MYCCIGLDETCIDGSVRFCSQFQVRATDNRLGVSQTGVATVSVLVLRDTAPSFNNLPQTITRDEANVQGDFVLQITAQDPNQIVSQLCTFFFLCVCVCVCVCVHMHACTCTHTHECAHMHVCAWVHVCMHVCVRKENGDALCLNDVLIFTYLYSAFQCIKQSYNPSRSTQHSTFLLLDQISVSDPSGKNFGACIFRAFWCMLLLVMMLHPACSKWTALAMWAWRQTFSWILLRLHTRLVLDFCGVIMIFLSRELWSQITDDLFCGILLVCELMISFGTSFDIQASFFFFF